MIHPPQEPDIVPGRPIAAIGFGVIVAVVLCALIALWIESCGTQGRSPSRAAEGPPIPEDVSGVETRPFSEQAQGIEMNQRASALLSTYSWVDRDRGIVRVPLEVAYQLLLERQRETTQPTGATQ
jgi:hypothetical protein